jgi:hypothetical protein
MNPVKYPRTPHLPWSESQTSDDKTLASVAHFYGKEVVVTEKMDGENTTMYSDFIHARSLDSIGGIDRDWLKSFWSSIRYDIPHGYRICGENLWARHSILYQNLPSYFLGFSIWNESNFALSWDETLDWFSLLNIISVPILYHGIWDDNVIRSICNNKDMSLFEGYVVRLADSFHYDNFSTSVAKFVRSGHVKTNKHWRYSVLVPNRMAHKPLDVI